MAALAKEIAILKQDNAGKEDDMLLMWTTRPCGTGL